MDHFELVSSYKPTGDQPEAIAKLTEGIEKGFKEQVLLGVTGSGKTFTMANIIAQVNKPTLVLAHNKTLAAQLCSEFREFFPNNAVEYFVSYYDYYQPEAYVPGKDVYIEKDSAVNAEIDKLRGGGYGANPKAEQERMELADSVFGDILPPRLVMHSLTGAITNPLVMLSGMENYYLAMYDAPDTLHEIMDMATRVYEDFYDYLERGGLLLPSVGISPVAQESYAFNSELPADKATRTTDVWGFLESQETTAVSPETYGEFVFPYQDRLARRYGLLSYGCCERVDAIFEDYLSKWKNLRKLSVSPFNNEPQVGEYLRGTNIVYYSKPRAEYVTNPGPLDEDALREYFKGVCEAASGCILEIAQREVGTIFGDFERGRRCVEIAKECVEKYWKP